MFGTSTLAIMKNAMYIPAFMVGLSLENYYILAALMVVDVMLGIIKTFVVNGGQHFTSYRLVAGILSKLSLIVVPVVLAAAGHAIDMDLIPLAKGALGMFILAQTYSILGSVYTINSGKPVTEFDAVSAILLRLRLTVETLIKGTKNNG